MPPIALNLHIMKALRYITIFLAVLFQTALFLNAQDSQTAATSSGVKVAQQGNPGASAERKNSVGEKADAQNAAKNTPDVSGKMDSAYNAEGVGGAVSKLSGKAEKLSPEEIEYRKYQEEIDREAVKNAKNIRVMLREVMHHIYKQSPSTARFLAGKYMGIRLVQYVASLLALIVTFIVARYMLNFLFSRLKLFSSKSGKENFASMFLTKIQTPVNMLAWVIGIYFALVFLIKDEGAIALISRAIGVLFGLSVFWTILIICDVLFSVITKKYTEKSASATVNLLEFLRRVIKYTIILIAILSILNNCGLNVNTIIASLGIGGMALAFASQDTIANFFGSVSIIIDRPFIVGDWVKTSVCEGHVEAIGFRSTRIRTFSKTLVTIPNSTLAKEAVENFSKMPLRKVEYTIGLTYSTTPDQMDDILHDLRKAIVEIEGVDPRSGVDAEFVNFGGSSLDIVITYFTKQIDLRYYRATIRRVNLEIMRIVSAHGLSFAFPSTSVYIESDATKA